MALADAASLRDALAAEGTAAQQADGAARDLQTRLASAGRQLAVKEEECARLNSALAQAQQAADAARAREEEARASAREMAERARRAETLAAEHQADVSQVHTHTHTHTRWPFPHPFTHCTAYSSCVSCLCVCVSLSLCVCVCVCSYQPLVTAWLLTCAS